MRVHIATDHAGLELSHYLIESLTAEGYEMIDHGPADYDPLDDYPLVLHQRRPGREARP